MSKREVKLREKRYNITWKRVDYIITLKREWMDGIYMSIYFSFGQTKGGLAMPMASKTK